MTSYSASVPVLLSISESCSAALKGVQADLKTCTALGLLGVCAVTEVSARGPHGQDFSQASTPQLLQAQLHAAGQIGPIGVVKTGRLPTIALVETVAAHLTDMRSGAEALPLVVDPSLLGGPAGAAPDAALLEAMTERIFPLATVITPNLTEAAWLTGLELSGVDSLEEGVRALHASLGVPILLKGGLLDESKECVDCLFDGEQLEFLASPYVPGIVAAGLGDTLSAALAIYLLRGLPLPDAAVQAKTFLENSLMNALPVGQYLFINHTHAPFPLEVM